MNRLTKFTAILFAVACIGSAAAYDFIYVEETMEYSKMVQISSLNSSGQGSISFEHECDYCPDSLEYNRDTQLTTPFGSRNISELTDWLNHNAMVHYSTTSPLALRITVFSTTDNAEEVQINLEEVL